MKHLLKLLLFNSLTLIMLSSCMAPGPPKVSFSGKLKPVNFGAKNNYNSTTVIKSAQVLNHYNKQFIYLIDEDATHSPEFLYHVIHADKIIARIRPPFVEFMYEQTIKSLREIGVTANIELARDKEDDGNDSGSGSGKNDAQVILECKRYKN